ncbi:MAG: DUF1059 domain-containing protein [Gemmatimonadota bacterium]
MDDAGLSSWLEDVCDTQDIERERGNTMAKTYTCRDVGVDCDWKTSAETEDEVMASIEEHAAQIHPDIELTPELVATVRGVIKDE